MNARILKKLCKRAAPLLPLLGDHREQFVVEDEVGWSCRRMDRKSIERWGKKLNGHGYYSPLKGTIAVGCLSGYYEPEWDDEPAYFALSSLVRNEFTEWPDHPAKPYMTRKIRNPSAVFSTAKDLLPA